MFGDVSKTVVKCLGAEKDLNYNGNVDQKIEMLTLVRVRRNFFGIPKYGIINKTLPDLLEELVFTPGVYSNIKLHVKSSKDTKHTVQLLSLALKIKASSASYLY